MVFRYSVIFKRYFGKMKKKWVYKLSFTSTQEQYETISIISEKNHEQYILRFNLLKYFRSELISLNLIPSLQVKRFKWEVFVYLKVTFI